MAFDDLNFSFEEIVLFPAFKEVLKSRVVKVYKSRHVLGVSVVSQVNTETHTRPGCLVELLLTSELHRWTSTSVLLRLDRWIAFFQLVGGFFFIMKVL